MSRYFTPATFKFLRGLDRNNSRAWFLEHKAQFEAHLRQPYLQLIADLAAPLAKISPHYVADPKPVGGSLFRIHRDTRFSKDKRPYKEWAGSQYFHKATRAAPRTEGAFGRLDAPVFYLHLEPGECFVGGGLWHPQPESLRKIRDYIVANPASWKTVKQGLARKGFKMSGESLKRPPRGYDPAHPLIEDLRKVSFTASIGFADGKALQAELAPFVIAQFRHLAPLADYLCGALDLDF